MQLSINLPPTLLDTERIYEEIIQKVVSNYGKTYTWELAQKLMGRPRRAFAERIVELMDLPISPAEFLDAIQSHSDEMLADANLMPGKKAYKKHY